MTGAWTHLPWGWFLGIAVVDIGLARFALRRRRDDRRLEVELKRAEASVLIRCHGWLVPRSRAAALEGRDTGEWNWPLHHEVLRSSVYNLRDGGGGLFVEEVVADHCPSEPEAALPMSLVGRGYAVRTARGGRVAA